MNYIIFYYFLLLNCMDKSKNEEEKEIKISEDNESYLSDDDDTPEDLFLFLMNYLFVYHHMTMSYFRLLVLCSHSNFYSSSI